MEQSSTKPPEQQSILFYFIAVLWGAIGVMGALFLFQESWLYALVTLCAGLLWGAVFLAIDRGLRLLTEILNELRARK